MCSFIDLDYTIINLPDVMFGIDSQLKPGGYRSHTNGLQIIRDNKGLEVVESLWHFLLVPKDGTMKPSKSTSFNSRWRGQFKRSFTKAFRETRCIIPASGFTEGLNKKYHHLKHEDGSPILFGGLYQEYGTEQGIITGASMITISPHPKLKGIHEQAMPFMLPTDDKQLIDMWLDAGLTDTKAFESYMEPEIKKDLVVTPLLKYAQLEPSGNSSRIVKD